jgi:hydroxymethylbilane synthase
MTSGQSVLLGTRGSRLALSQAEACARRLRAAGGLGVEIRVIKATSDHHPETPLSVIDQRDVFTRQLDEALLNGEIDLAIHSLKDVPTWLPEGILLAAITQRYDPSDVLVSEARYDVDGLPLGAVVATSSLRRRAQLLHRRPDLRIVEIRGNVETRIHKMRQGRAAAIVLARAGLERLGLEVPHTIISPQIMLPAVGQGALTAAMLEEHPLRGRIRETLNHGPTERAVLAERAMLHALEGGCRVPVGAFGVLEGGAVRLRGVVASPEGTLVYRGGAEGEEPEEVGRRLARELLERGAAAVLGEVRSG